MERDPADYKSWFLVFEIEYEEALRRSEEMEDLNRIREVHLGHFFSLFARYIFQIGESDYFVVVRPGHVDKIESVKLFKNIVFIFVDSNQRYILMKNRVDYWIISKKHLWDVSGIHEKEAREWFASFLRETEDV